MSTCHSSCRGALTTIPFRPQTVTLLEFLATCSCKLKSQSPEIHCVPKLLRRCL